MSDVRLFSQYSQQNWLIFWMVSVRIMKGSKNASSDFSLRWGRIVLELSEKEELRIQPVRKRD